MKTTIQRLILTLIIINPQTTIAQCHIDDWFALRQLYLNTDGDNWFLKTGWEEITNVTPSSECNLENLYGISLNESGRVFCIDLDGAYTCGWSGGSGNNLTGSLPAEIGYLSKLQRLYLGNNHITGGIPLELGNLNSLMRLDLYNNQLSGSIPAEIGNLSNLENLYLDKNQLSGSIPDGLGNLVSLIELDVSSNLLIGSIPIQLGDLTNLIDLDLSINQLSSSIPTELGNLSNLQYLHLYDNQLSGSISPELGNLSNLIQLYSHNNQLSGSIPPELGNLGSLKYLRLDDNQLSGSIPPELGSLSNLIFLYLLNNQLSGSIPPELGNLSNLTILYLHMNQLSGSIPPKLSNLSNLERLYLYNNQFSGSIPPELGNLSKLQSLYLYNNQLSGSIPPELGNLQDLEELWLFGNQLSGNIPPELGNLSNLTLLRINDNNLSGCYPANISTFCTQLISQFFDGNPDISKDNNFDATWEDFCATGAGACIDDCEENCETNVYPGDLNHDGIVNNQDISLSGLFHYNSGSARASEHQNTDWYAHPAENWNILNNQNKDLKHHDCNGDGVIDENDAQAVQDNMGLMWSEPDPVDSPEESDYQVMLQPIEQIFDGNLVMNVSLERRAGGDLTLQSGHFTVDYDGLEANFNSVVLNFLPISWLGTPNNNLWYESTHFPDQKKIEVGFTRTNNTNTVGNGVIGQLILEYDSSNLKKANTNYQFEVYTIGVHRNSG